MRQNARSCKRWMGIRAPVFGHNVAPRELVGMKVSSASHPDCPPAGPYPASRASRAVLGEGEGRAPYHTSQ
jgi:hypothetical protein